MCKVINSKFIDKKQFIKEPLWHIVRRDFLTTCPHCAQNIYVFTDAISESIKWNELSGHHIPIGGLRKPFPHEKRMSGCLLNCYRNDEHMFAREKQSPFGFVNFCNREDAEKFLKEVVIPRSLPFDPSVFKYEEARKMQEETIERLAKENYFIIPVYPADNVEYCIGARLYVEDYNRKKFPNPVELIILSDIFVTIEVEKYIK